MELQGRCRLKHTLDGVSRSHWYGGLLYDDLVRSSNLGNLTSTKFTILNIRSTTSTNTGELSGGIDTDKDNIGLADGIINVGAEE